MMKWIKTGILGVLLGVIGGIVVGKMNYSDMYKKLAMKKLQEAEVFADGNSQTDILQRIFGEEVEEGTDDGHGGLTNCQVEHDPSNVMRLFVEYKGKEKMTNKEKEHLENSVKTAVKYSLSDKLGENYCRDMTLDELEAAIEKHKEEIEKDASDAAGEWGIILGAKLFIKEKELPKYTNDAGEVFPSGVYRVLVIELI